MDAQPRHVIAVRKLDLEDQADRLAEAHAMFYRISRVLRVISHGELDPDFVVAVAGLAEVAVERMAEFDMETSSVFARGQI